MARKKAHGIGLLSGGLDSALAAKVVQAAGAEVTCLHFFTGFCVTGHNSRIGRKDRPIANHALNVAADADIPVELVDISEDYLPMVMKPVHGYGANMNPCIDCRVFMIDRAKRHMEEVGADFVFTGEVIGQRPMSQRRPVIDMVEKQTGLQGRLLRPLSAKLLEPTLVEQQGLVDREKLYGFHGRSRRPQIALANELGINEFMQPAGGCCFLTDESYSRKLRDLMSHMPEGSQLDMDAVYTLGVGRHFRLSGDLKVIVGRDETENNFLDYYRRTHWVAEAVDFKGPTVVVMGEPGDHIPTVAAMVARYCKGREEATVKVAVTHNGDSQVIEAAPVSDDRLETFRI